METEAARMARERVNAERDMENMAIEEAIGAIPTSNSSAEYVYWYLFQRSFNLETGGNTFEPQTLRVPAAEGKDKVQWIAKVRSLILGTDSSETVARVKEIIAFPEDVSLRTAHSFRGSASPLTALGDYALFFVGVDKRTIWYMYYEDGEQAGYKTKEATLTYKMKSEVRDMVWDNDRKGLFVLTEERKLHVFYLHAEYGVEGWVDWDINEAIGKRTQIINFEGDREVTPLKINKFVYYRGRVGFTTADPPGFYLFKKHDSFNLDDYQDTDGDLNTDIDLEVDFFKTGDTGGELGDTAARAKGVGYSTIYVDIPIRDEGIPSKILMGPRRVIKVLPYKGTPLEVRGIEPFVENNGTDLPTMRIAHTGKEKLQILSTSSRIESKEMN